MALRDDQDNKDPLSNLGVNQIIGGSEDQEEEGEKKGNKYINALTDMPTPLKKMQKSCTGCMGQMSCFVLAFLGIPGFILGLLSGLGVI